MKRLFLIFGGLILISSISFAQTNTDKLKKIKSIELRSNSRDISPVRKTNLHKNVNVRQYKALTNAKRLELRQKRAQFQRQKLMQNRKRMMQLQRLKRKKATMNRRGR